MNAYENMFKLRLPSDDRYRAHQQVDTLIQERLGIKLPYTWRISPFPSAAQHSLVQIVSGFSLGLPGESVTEYSFKNGSIVRFECEFNSEIMLPLKDGQRRRSGKHGSFDEVLPVFAKTSEKNGLGLLAVEPIDEEKYQIKKPKTPKFTLGCQRISVVAKVNDPFLFEKAVAEGIGKKRMFGFGMIYNLGVI